MIFDRIGEKVFESEDLNFMWDGTYKGKPLSPSVFAYTIQVLFDDGHADKLFNGSVTLLK
jgi:gliding motility-associated-like protein